MKKIMLCSLLALGGASAQTGAQVFALNTSSLALLLQWTEAGGQLTGSAQVVSVQPTSSDIGLTVNNASLSGTQSAGSYAFVLNKSLTGLGVNSLAGNVVGGTLNIQIPSDSGGFTSLQLKRTTLDQFSASVSTLKANALRARQGLADQKTLAAAQVDALGSIRDLGVNNDRLATSNDDLKRLLKDATNAVVGFKKSHVNLASLVSRQQCDEFKASADRAAESRIAAEDALNLLAGEVDLNADLADQAESLPRRFATALSQYKNLAPAPAATLERQSAPALATAKRLLTGSSLVQAQKFQADSGALVEQLADEDENLSCP